MGKLSKIAELTRAKLRSAGRWAWVALGLVGAGAVALLSRKKKPPAVTSPEPHYAPTFKDDVEASRRKRELANLKAELEIAAANTGEAKAQAEVARALAEPDEDKQLDELIALKNRLMKGDRS